MINVIRGYNEVAQNLFMGEWQNCIVIDYDPRDSCFIIRYEDKPGQYLFTKVSIADVRVIDESSIRKP